VQPFKRKRLKGFFILFATKNNKEVRSMRTGIIVYVTGEPSKNLSINPEADRKRLGLDADAVAWIAADTGEADIHYAWWALQSRGIARVICKTATVDPAGALRLTGRELRLCG
jgi:hypothetical protein